MTEQEAREKAEEYNIWAMNQTVDPTCGRHRPSLINAYMQCYRDMCAGEPEAYVMDYHDGTTSEIAFDEEDLISLFDNRPGFKEYNITPVKLVRCRDE